MGSGLRAELALGLVLLAEQRERVGGARRRLLWSETAGEILNVFCYPEAFFSSNFVESFLAF